jgi:hypothetical protein
MADRKQRFWRAVADCLGLWPFGAWRGKESANRNATEHDWKMVGYYLQHAMDSCSLNFEPNQLSLFDLENDRRRRAEPSSKQSLLEPSRQTRRLERAPIDDRGASKV